MKATNETTAQTISRENLEVHVFRMSTGIGYGYRIMRKGGAWALRMVTGFNTGDHAHRQGELDLNELAKHYAV